MSSSSKILGTVITLMKESGFPINAEVKIEVDPNLSFMGYTAPRENSHVIVVSAFSQKSEMFQGLLMHELSHIYRTTSGHPSHNYELIEQCMGDFKRKHGLDRDYQESALHTAVNHIQDLYADDIVMSVVDRTGLVPRDTIGEFFLGWIQDSPETGESYESKWANAAIMLKNSFALSNIQRHHLQNVIKTAEKRNGEFLAKLPKEAASEFQNFNRFMAGLKEDWTYDEYARKLNNYLETFLLLTRKI